MDWFGGLLFLVVSAVVLGFCLKLLKSEARSEGRRVGRISAVAEEYGFNHVFTPHWGISSVVEEQQWVQQVIGQRFSGFWPFDGPIRSIRNVVTGPIGDLSFEAFEFELIYQNEKGRVQGEWVTVVSISMPVAFPGVSIGFVEGWTCPIVATESVQFNKIYPVRSEDPRFAFGLIHPQMIEFILSSRVPAIQIGGSRLVVVSSDKLDAHAIGAMRSFYQKFWEFVPNYIKEDFAKCN